MPRTSPPSVRPDLPRWRESFVTSDDGTKLYVRERAVGKPVTALLCDGIACDGFIWRYLVEDLLGDANVVHWHYRGHGRSSAPGDPERVTMKDVVDDLEAVRRECIDGPVILFGHSMGCQSALEGYRRNPEGIAGLVLINGAAGRITHSFKGSDALARALPVLIDQVDRHPHISRALWSNFPPDVAARIALATGEVDAEAIDADDLVRYSEHVANLDLRMFLRMLRSVGDATAEDMLSTIDIPVLVIAGEGDSFTPTHLAEAMAAAIPDSELVVVEGGTHVVPIERREQLLARVRAFIQTRAMA